MDNLQFNNENQTPQNAGLDKDKIIKLAVAGVAAVVLVVLIVVLFTSLFGGGYKKAIKSQIKLINKQTEDGLEYQKYSSIENGYDITKMLCEYSEEYLEDNYEENYEDAVDYLKDEFGRNYKITYKIAEAEKMEKDDVADIQEYFEEAWEDADEDFEDEWEDYYEEYYEEEYDLSSKELKKVEAAMEKYYKATAKKVKVSAVYEVELECKIKGSEDSEEFDLDDIMVAKVNGDWVFLYEGGDDDDKYWGMTTGITPVSVVYAIED